MTSHDPEPRPDFLDVTEITNQPISAEQMDRLVSRYVWATSFCRDKDVVEAACGTGPGLGLLASVARSVEAGDYSRRILEIAHRHYGNRITLQQFDAQEIPFPEASKDIIVLFEAIYYLSDAERFVAECARVLRANGTVLISSANKDLWDFHPSPHAQEYFGVPELETLFSRFGFSCEFFGFQPIDQAPLRQRLLRPVKHAAVACGLMPTTMSGKRWLKRIVFGPEMPMPAELITEAELYVPPQRIPSGQLDRRHKIIYCAATRGSQAQKD